MNIIIPEKLKKGDEIRVIAPSRSLALISDEVKKIAINKLEEQGYKVTFSKNCLEKDMFMSSSIESRVADIHDAFRDENVKAILTVVGGFNSNQLLKYLDYDLIRNNPKIICGYSDITALNNAIFAKTSLVTYIGTHFSTWGMKKGFDYSLEYFNKCLTTDGSYKIYPAADWSDDAWYLDQDNRNFIKNDGPVIIHEGEASGIALGGNLNTLNLLQGTEFMPDIRDSILFIEDTDQAGDLFSIELDRDLQSLISQPGFERVRGIVIGRFQKKTDINLEKLRYIISTKKELKNMPVVSYMNFGHTYPLFTFPVGGQVKIIAKDGKVNLEIITH
jgi:muramoyltetrapeptide carboxypeptidase LdcA involved in peptidoglycan recycling